MTDRDAPQPEELGEQFSYATVPTRRTRWLRTFIPWQLVRFVVINLKMLRLLRRGH
ncbi:MAG: hypothetical protein Q8L86_13595 [Vicinamibacterales bacterium]|nr:hypothetical protein [Vicinamibacterales bacterium]